MVGNCDAGTKWWSWKTWNQATPLTTHLSLRSFPQASTRLVFPGEGGSFSDGNYWLSTLDNPDTRRLWCFIDQNNLIFLFDPLPDSSDLLQTSLRKFLRWVVWLSVYKYACFHIKRPNNLQADMLGSWSAFSDFLCLVPFPKSLSCNVSYFEWPAPSNISKEQKEHFCSLPKNVTIHNRLWSFNDEFIWTPDGSDDLQLRYFIIPHTGWSGHHGSNSTVIINDIVQILLLKDVWEGYEDVFVGL